MTFEANAYEVCKVLGGAVLGFIFSNLIEAKKKRTERIKILRSDLYEVAENACLYWAKNGIDQALETAIVLKFHAIINTTLAVGGGYTGRLYENVYGFKKLITGGQFQTRNRTINLQIVQSIQGQYSAIDKILSEW